MRDARRRSFTRSVLLVALSAVALGGCEGVLGLDSLTDSYSGGLDGSSGGSSGGSSADGGGSSCLDSVAFASYNAACVSCTQSECPSQVSAIESGCSDYLSCVCPAGRYDSSLAAQCQSQGSEPSCTSALSTVEECQSSACSSQCTGGSDASVGSGDSAVGCNEDSTVSCVGGAYGFSCPPGYDPESFGNAAWSCSSAVVGPNGNNDYCCFQWSYGTGSCTPDDGLSGCSSPSYGYQCLSGQTPSQIDSALTCNMSMADADGVHTDWCCEY